MISHLCIAILCLISSTVYATTLTPEGLIEAIRHDTPLLAIIGVTWCHESTRVVSAIDDIDTELRTYAHTHIHTAVVIEDRLEGGFRQELGIDEYPHISLFIDGTQIRYDGNDNSVYEIAKFVDRKLRTECVYIRDMRVIDEMITSEAKVVLFTGNKSHEMYREFVIANHMYDELVYYYSDNASILDAYDLDANSLYVVLNRSMHTKYDGTWQSEEINKWIYDNTTPRLTYMTDQLYDQIISTKSPALILLLGHEQADGDTHNRELVQFMQDSSAVYYATFYGVICNATSDACDRLMRVCRYVPVWPSVVAVLQRGDHDDAMVFEYPGDDLNTHDLGRWLEDVKKGTAKLYTLNDPRAKQPQNPSNHLKFIDFDSLSSILGSSSDLILALVDDDSERSTEWLDVADRLNDIAGRLDAYDIADKVKFRVINMQRNSVFAFDIEKNDIPSVRFYRRYDAANPHRFGLEELRTRVHVLNMVVDLASEDLLKDGSIYDDI